MVGCDTIKSSRSDFIGQRAEVVNGVVTSQRQLETSLAIFGAMAGSRVATESRQGGLNITYETGLKVLALALNGNWNVRFKLSPRDLQCRLAVAEWTNKANAGGRGHFGIELK